MRRVLSLTLPLLAVAAAAQAAPDVVNYANHGVYGRLIVRLKTKAPAGLIQRDRQLDISVPDESIGQPRRLPRNVLTFTGGDGGATVGVRPGAQIKTSQNGNLLIIDVLDPLPEPRRTAKAIASGNLPTANNPVLAAPALVSTDPALTSPLQPTLAQQAPVKAPPPATPVLAAPATLEPAAKPAELPVSPSSAGDARSVEANPPASKSTPIHIAAAPEVGAAAFRRGELGVVVFDDRVEPALSGDGLPSRATVLQMQGATMLTLTLSEDESLLLARDRDGWVVTLGSANATAASQSSVAEGVAFQFPQSGRALTISDPVTGQTLLLGTLRQAGVDRTIIDARRSATGYVLLPTWLGLALEVTSDNVDLRATSTGFTLQIPDRAAPGTAVTATQDNPFGIPTAAPEILIQRLSAQIASAATSPPRSRGGERVAAAKTMLALGMAVEAQALLSLASNDDPNIAADPNIAGLTGIAAVLAQRPGEASGLDHPNLPASSDVALWRGLRDAQQGKPAPNLGSLWPTLARYPTAMRQRVGPTVIEAAIDVGSAIPPSELEGPAFAFARALQKEKFGSVEPALEDYDAVASQRDERDSVRATVAAAELRLRTGKITPGVAADQIQRQTLRWRGNVQELSMRLRVAELRTMAGQWRPALEILRQTEALFPDAKQRIATSKASVFTQLLSAKQETLNPLELVTLAGDFADCIPDGKDGERLAGLLAEKLAALDLPSRAIPVLQRLLDGTASPAGKAEIALRLAKLQLDAGEPVKAEGILASMDVEALPHERADQRLILLARARAGRGDPAGAATLLAGLGTTATEEMRAAFLAKAGDWEASLRALQKIATTAVPETGDLTEQQQDLVLREATAAVQAGNTQAVRDLKRFDARMKPPRADVFRLLTANAVESPDDLPRSARELAMSRGLSDRLNALKTR